MSLRLGPPKRFLRFLTHVCFLRTKETIAFFLPLYYALLNPHNWIARATALTLAIIGGHTETVRALLESGALPENNVLNEQGTDLGSHARVALLNGHLDIYRLLLGAPRQSKLELKTCNLDTESVGAARPTDYP